MKVITAPNLIDNNGLPTVFLAGGITNCPWWQDEIIKLLSKYESAVLINPRRRNFPIHDPNAAKEQISWEFNALNNCNIFSMWFSAGPSVQPICMYELGRHLALKEPSRVVIGVEEGYLRSQDVYIQSELVNFYISKRISTTLEEHAEKILHAIALL